jgi:hypothetical protein
VVDIDPRKHPAQQTEQDKISDVDDHALNPMSSEVEERVRLACGFVAEEPVNKPLRYQQQNDVEIEKYSEMTL